MSNKDQNDHRSILHISSNTLHQQNAWFFDICLFLTIVFCLQLKTEWHFSIIVWHTDCTPRILFYDCQNCGCHWNFSAEGAEVFDMGLLNKKFIQSRLQIPRGRFLCHVLDGGLIVLQRLYWREKMFSIFVLLAFKYRQHINIHCTPMSPHSAMHQQRPRISADLPPSGQSTLVWGRHPSVCLYRDYVLLKIRMPQKLQNLLEQILWQNDYQVQIWKEPAATK